MSSFRHSTAAWITAAALFLALTVLADGLVLAQNQPPPPPPPDQTSQTQQENQDSPPAEEDQAPYAKLSERQLERLVAPIALYPDALVAQILTAATFPSQIDDAENWLKENPGLSADELGKQVDAQSWDPAVKALCQYPSVLHNLAVNLGWTSELGDAYYNQQQDVMDAVQRMRRQAEKAGNLKSTQQLSVENKDDQVDIAPANPNVVYVPAYDPWLVYGYPITPWPYWVSVPGIWWSGPGLYFGVGFPILPYFGFGWGWHYWGLNWVHGGVFWNHAPYFPHSPAFFNRGGYYAGHPGFTHPGGYRGWLGGGDAYRGYTRPSGEPGTRSGAFGGYTHGGVARGFSARGQSSSGGFHGGGFGGGGFHGGGRR